MKRYIFLIAASACCVTHTANKQFVDQQKKFFYASTGLFSGYGTIKYLSFLALIKNFDFLKAKKGGFLHTVSKKLASKFVEKYPGYQRIIQAMTAIPALLPRVSLSTVGRIYFGKKALLGVGGLLYSVRELQKMKKEFD